MRVDCLGPLGHTPNDLSDSNDRCTIRRNEQVVELGKTSEMKPLQA